MTKNGLEFDRKILRATNLKVGTIFIIVRRCQFFVHVHRFWPYSFGHLDSVKWITLYMAWKENIKLKILVRDQYTGLSIIQTFLYNRGIAITVARFKIFEKNPKLCSRMSEQINKCPTFCPSVMLFKKWTKTSSDFYNNFVSEK